MHHFCTWMHRQNRQVNNINKPAISVAICSLELDYSLQGSQTAVSSLMLPALNPVKNKQTKKKSRSAVSLWSDGCFTLIYQSQVLEPGEANLVRGHFQIWAWWVIIIIILSNHFFKLWKQEAWTDNTSGTTVGKVAQPKDTFTVGWILSDNHYLDLNKEYKSKIFWDYCYIKKTDQKHMTSNPTKKEPFFYHIC